VTHPAREATHGLSQARQGGAGIPVSETEGGGEVTGRKPPLGLPGLLWGLIALAVGLHGAWPLSGGVWPGLGLVGVGSLAWLWVSTGGRGAGIGVGPLLLGALGLRLLALGAAPSLSDDVQRYVWEGEVLSAGYSPYAHAPSSPALGELRAREPDLARAVAHPEVAAAYPPTAQLTHAAVVSLMPRGRRVWGMKLVYGLADLAVLWPLLVLLRRRGRPPGEAVAWAWSPLVTLEFAGSGHLDALGILLLLGALALLGGGRPAARIRESLGIGSLALAAMTKYLPLFALPFVLRGPRPARRAVLFALVVGLLWSPILFIEGGVVPGGLADYGRSWQGGSLVFHWIDLAVRGLHMPYPQWCGRGLVGLLWGAIAVGAWRAKLPVERATGLLIGAFLVLSPTLHPWYLTWALPFAILDRCRAWLVLVALAPLLYWPLAGWHARGEWVEPAWLGLALALPFFAVLYVDRPRARDQSVAP
jgi:hypothetical protein